MTKYVTVEGLGVIAKRVGYGPGAVTHWLHNDRLGSIQAVTDATGAVDYRRSYRPYGETLAEAGSPTESRGWIDQRNDPETGLTYLHARYYDPQIGVFLSPDPIGVAGGMNQYAYAAGNPANFTDRSGLDLRATVGSGAGCGTLFAPCPTTITYGGSGSAGSGELPGPIGFIVGLIDLLFGSEPTGPYTVPVHRVPGIVYADDPRVTGPQTPVDVPTGPTPPTTPPPGGGRGGGAGSGGGQSGGGGRPRPGPVVVPMAPDGQPYPTFLDVRSNTTAAAEHGYDVFWFASQVGPGRAWDYKNLYGDQPLPPRARRYLETLGNFNYGATGAALGIPKSFLLRAAGAVQTYTAASRALRGRPFAYRPEWGNFMLYAPYGDDPDDQLWIGLGYDCYKQGACR